MNHWSDFVCQIRKLPKFSPLLVLFSYFSSFHWAPVYVLGWLTKFLPAMLLILIGNWIHLKGNISKSCIKSWHFCLRINWPPNPGEVGWVEPQVKHPGSQKGLIQTIGLNSGFVRKLTDLGLSKINLFLREWSERKDFTHLHKPCLVVRNWSDAERLMSFPVSYTHLTLPTKRIV